MKSRVALLSILVLLLVLTGVAWADELPAGTFTITGNTTSISPWPPGRRAPELDTWPPRVRPDGTLKVHIKAEGTVSGNLFDGSEFTFQEWVVTDTTDPFYAGYNNGRMTIEAGDGGKAVIEFEGPADFYGVSGTWAIHHGTGQFKGLEGSGTYLGVAGFCDPAEVPPGGCTGFSVEFTPATSQP